MHTHRRIIYCSVDCPAVKSLKRGAVWVGPGIQLADMRQGFCALVYNVNAKFLSITKRHKHANLSIIDYRTAHPCCAFLRVGISPVFLHVSLVFVCFCFLFSVSKIDGNDNDRLGLTTPDFTNSQWRVRRRRWPNVRPVCGRCKPFPSSIRPAYVVSRPSTPTATLFGTRSSIILAW